MSALWNKDASELNETLPKSCVPAQDLPSSAISLAPWVSKPGIDESCSNSTKVERSTACISGVNVAAKRLTSWKRESGSSKGRWRNSKSKTQDRKSTRLNSSH